MDFERNGGSLLVLELKTICVSRQVRPPGKHHIDVYSPVQLVVDLLLNKELIPRLVSFGCIQSILM